LLNLCFVILEQNTKYNIKNILSFIFCSNFILNCINEINFKTFKTKNVIDNDIYLYVNINYKNIHISHNCIIINNIDGDTKKIFKRTLYKKN
jgi:hypothetical protein